MTALLLTFMKQNDGYPDQMSDKRTSSLVDTTNFKHSFPRLFPKNRKKPNWVCAKDCDKQIRLINILKESRGIHPGKKIGKKKSIKFKIIKFVNDTLIITNIYPTLIARLETTVFFETSTMLKTKNRGTKTIIYQGKFNSNSKKTTKFAYVTTTPNIERKHSIAESNTMKNYTQKIKTEMILRTTLTKVKTLTEKKFSQSQNVFRSNADIINIRFYIFLIFNIQFYLYF